MKKIRNAVAWRPEWSPEKELEIAAGVEELRRSNSALRDLRESLGISQEELADVLGMTQSNISKIEAKDEPRLSVLRRLVEHKGGRLKLVIEMDGKDTEWPFNPAA